MTILYFEKGKKDKKEMTRNKSAEIKPLLHS